MSNDEKKGKWGILSKKGSGVKTDDSEGGSGGEVGTVQGESYATILTSLGVDVKGLNVEEIQELIHQYEQEGILKGADVIDIKTGKRRRTFKKSNKNKGRTYQVKQDDSIPMTPEQVREKEYKESSQKQKTSKPDVTPMGPKPKGPVI